MAEVLLTVSVDTMEVLDSLSDDDLLEEVKVRKLKGGHHPQHDELLIDLAAMFEDMARRLPVEEKLREISWKYFGKVLPL